MAARPELQHPILKPLSAEHVQQVSAIETSAYPFPWTEGIFSDCIRVGYDCWGLFDGRAVIGYSIQSHAAGECHLLNLCIAPAYQGQRLGTLMLDHVIRRALAHGSQCIFLEVRPSNEIGQQLYLANGFRVVGRRREYYRSEDGREDAVVMRRDF